MERGACGPEAHRSGLPCSPPRARRQLQVQEVKAKYPDVPKYGGVVDCFAGILRREGVRGLFRGIWPNYLKVAPSVAVQFVIFEAASKRFEQWHARIKRRSEIRMGPG